MGTSTGNRLVLPRYVLVVAIDSTGYTGTKFQGKDVKRTRTIERDDAANEVQTKARR